MDKVKKAVGVRAAELIESGMVVGLGTGTTAFYFIERLIERCRGGLKITAVASSSRSLEQARAGGIPLVDIDQIAHIDITVDGADEIDPLKRMIKGGGGALVREKIVASMSREMIVIIDESKLVHQLGHKKLPVEIIPFGRAATIHKIEKLGYSGKWRKTGSGEFYLTDNGNLIFDIQLREPTSEPEKIDTQLRSLPGVVDTGFFFHLAGRVIVGFNDGQVAIR
jgi:ribose 5-phosphate isomerase A